jgi:ABC-type transport system involved in multi-copper enzyme maturation permease subunit
VETRDPIDDRKKLQERKNRFPFYLIDPLRRKKEIEDDRNPMLVKELRWGMLGRADTLIRLFYVSAIAYFCIGLSIDAWRDAEIVQVLIILQISITLLIAPALLANTFTKEHEQGNYDMLRMTLLSPREVVMGKVQAGMVSVAPLVLAAVLSNVPYMILVKGSMEVFFAGYVTFLVCCYLTLGISIFCSLLMERTTTSLVVSYLLNALMFVGMVGIIIVIYEIFGWDIDEAAALYFSPITAFARLFQHSGGDRSGLLAYWGSNAILFYGIAWFFIRLTIAGYRKGLSDR